MWWSRGWKKSSGRIIIHHYPWLSMIIHYYPLLSIIQGYMGYWNKSMGDFETWPRYFGDEEVRLRWRADEDEILAKGTRPLSQSGETAVKGVIWELQILLLARIWPFLLVEVTFHPFPRRRVRWTIATWQVNRLLYHLDRVDKTVIPLVCKKYLVRSFAECRGQADPPWPECCS